MIPFDICAEAAQRLGFNGDLTNEAAVRSFLRSNKRAWKFDGQVVTPEMIGGEDEAPVEITRKAAPKAETPKADDDMGLKVAAAVEMALRKAGVNTAAGERPKAPEQTPAVKVRSAAERIWDAIPEHQKAFRSFDEARAGQLYLQTQLVPNSRLWKQEEAEPVVRSATAELAKRNYATFPNSAGGALVNEAFDSNIIRLVNQWGVARRECRVVPMTEAKVSRPRARGDFTLQYINENTAATPQVMSYDNVTLEAKTGLALARVSKQLMQDSAIDIANDITIDMARGIARQEDRNLFLGDGTSAFGNVIGFVNRFAVGTTGNAVTGGATFSAHTVAQLCEAIGRVSDFGLTNAKWYCSPAFKAQVFDRLSLTMGGVTRNEFAVGTIGSFLNYPIVSVNALPSVDGTNQLDCLFGDISLAASLGSRLDVEMAIDDSVGFNTYSTFLRAVVRHDINIHDIGSTTAGAPTPLVAFYQS